MSASNAFHVPVTRGVTSSVRLRCMPPPPSLALPCLSGIFVQQLTSWAGLTFSLLNPCAATMLRFFSKHAFLFLRNPGKTSKRVVAFCCLLLGGGGSRAASGIDLHHVLCDDLSYIDLIWRVFPSTVPGNIKMCIFDRGSRLRGIHLPMAI